MLSLHFAAVNFGELTTAEGLVLADLFGNIVVVVFEVCFDYSLRAVFMRRVYLMSVINTYVNQSYLVSEQQTRR
jgi:hypothetical protein